MRSSLAALSALLLASAAHAFRDSSPLLIWSSVPNEAIHDAAEAITSGVISAEEVFGTMASLGCDWDTLVVAHVDELHQSHIPSLSLPQSEADLHIPYLVRPTRTLLDSAVDEWAKICGAEITHDLDSAEGKSIVKLDIAKDDNTLTTLSSRLPSSHLIVLTGSRSQAKVDPKAQTHAHAELKRQERPFPSHTTTAQPSSTHSGGMNTTIPTSGHLLDRYQLLTTPIITALLISFGLFVPIILFGVNALASIQVPPRMMEIGKGMVVGKEKKDQ
ncbi:hypothetical protein JCM24511_06492 [Saitozyma sp. JCM 24511]|nr:hypothetical protein JCM24511_06492 [Saitozyma sp. JCM 24511]